MRAKAPILIFLCAALPACERETAMDDPGPTAPRESGTEAAPVPAAIAEDPRLRLPTAEERATMQAKIEIAKRDPKALLDIVHHGDPTGWISRRQAISLLSLHCDEWRILASVILDLEGAAQVQLACQMASKFSFRGDFDSANQLVDALNPGVARATALREVLRDQVSVIGPDELLGRLHDCEPDEIELAVVGFASGASRFFKENPAANRPDLTQYEAIKGLPARIADSYVEGNATSRPHESLDFMKDLEHTDWKELVAPLLNSWAQDTKAPFDDALVEKVLSIQGATDSWAVRKKLEEFGGNP